MLLERFFQHLTVHMRASDLLPAFQVSLPTSPVSTEKAVLHVLLDILTGVNQVSASALVLLDMADFHKFGYNIYLRQLLSLFGLSGSACSWLQPHLNVQL
jgi:hypothetical protein